MLLDNVIIDPAKPILIAGPTASGKSALALDLAQRFNGVIVNADALQVYRCWRVLTARPTAADEARLPHRLYGHIGCDVAYSVGAWLRQIAPILSCQTGGLPIIVGGTGLYFSALTNGLADIPQVSSAVRAKSEARLATAGLAALVADLQQADPRTIARIDRLNPVRVLRAWEVLHATGQGLAAWQDKTPPPLLALKDANALVLDVPKEALNRRIDARFRTMVATGGIEECRANLANQTAALPASKAIGAAELTAYLNAETDLETAIGAAQIATRQYAKRQRSWFRGKMKDWTWIKLSTEACD